MRRSVRLRALYTDKRRASYLFDNLHCLDTAASAGPAEAATGADLLAAADWWAGRRGRRAERAARGPADQTFSHAAALLRCSASNNLQSCGRGMLGQKGRRTLNDEVDNAG